MGRWIDMPEWKHGVTGETVRERGYVPEVGERVESYDGKGVVTRVEDSNFYNGYAIHVDCDRGRSNIFDATRVAPLNRFFQEG